MMRRAFTILSLFLFIAIFCPAIQEQSFLKLDEVKILLKEKNYSEAESKARRILEEVEAIHGSNSMEVAQVLDLLVECILNKEKKAGDESRALIERALSIREKILGTEHPDVAKSMKNFALLLKFKGDFDWARTLLEQALMINNKAFGPDHIESAEILNNLGKVEKETRNFERALEYYQRALEIQEREFGQENLSLAQTLKEIGSVYWTLGKWAQQKSYCERALAIQEKSLGPDHSECGDTLISLGGAISNMGNYAEAIPILERSISILENTLGTENLRVAQGLTNLGITLDKMGEHTKAIKYLAHALAIREKIIGTESAEVASNLEMLGAFLMEMGEYEKSREMLERGLAIQEKIFGSEHPNITDFLNWIGILLIRAQQPAEAKIFFERALVILEEAFGPGSGQTVSFLINLGNVSESLGDYVEAKAFYEHALAIQEKTLSPEHPWLANNLNNLGSLLIDMGDYTSAARYIERVLTIREKIYGPEHLRVAQSLGSLGIALRELGDYERAKSVLQRSLSIKEKILEPGDPQIAIVLNNLSNTFANMGDHARAESMIRRALEIQEKAYGPTSERLTCYLINYAHRLKKSGEIGSAKEVLERALNIQEKNQGLEHPHLAMTLQDLASIHQSLGEVKKATELIDRAHRIFEKSFGQDHPYMASILNDSALYSWCEGQTAPALEKAIQAGKIVRNRAQQGIQSLSERQALAYLSIESTGYGLNISLSLATAHPEEIRGAEGKVWDALIRSRALLFDELAARNRTVAEKTDPELVALTDSVVSARRRLANLVVRGPGPCDPVESYLKLLDQIRNEKEQAERALAETSSDSREASEQSHSYFAKVKDALPPRFALVAYGRYIHYELVNDPSEGKDGQSYEPKKIPSYLAFVLRTKKEEPIVIPLGNAEDIESLIFDWGQEAARGIRIPGRSSEESESAYRAAGESLRQKVWDPILPHLGDASRVLLVPDGSLHTVNFATLPVGSQNYLIERGPLLHYLSAERDLLFPRDPTAHGKGLLALGDPAFDDTSLFASLSPETKPKKGLFDRIKSAFRFRGMRSGCEDFKTLHFDPLPATNKEINEVSPIWKKSGERKGDVLKLTGAMANEAEFKMAAPGKQILHLATHGFFLENYCPSALARLDKQGESRNVEFGNLPHVTGENPLLLTGLALAGANHRDAAGPEEDDGILTAEEVATLDLAGVDLVVLSACDTGVGQIKAGEGVFGFRRAFRLAGAHTLITSLWPVEDELSRKWMSEFYKACFTKGLGKAESVAQASMKILKELRKKRKSTHPFYWAGFIASGDWR